jgi:hypothetical protein
MAGPPDPKVDRIDKVLPAKPSGRKGIDIWSPSLVVLSFILRDGRDGDDP